MKSKIFAFIVLAMLALSARASYQVVTVTVTNTPANGDTITINGSARTWTNSVFVPSTQILIGASANPSATNLYLQLAANKVPQTIVTMTATNAIKVQGDSLAAFISGTWASLSTNSLVESTGRVYRLPLEVEQAAQRTNMASMAVKGQSDYATNPYAPSSIAMSNFVNTSTTQSIAGSKIFTGYGAFGGNLQSYMPLLLWDSASNSVSALYMIASGSGVTNYLFGTATGFAFGSPVALGGNLTVGPWAITGSAFAITTAGFNGDGSAVTNISGTNIQSGSILGAQLSQKGIYALGTNALGDVAFPRFAVSSLANGVNAAVPVGTNTFVEVSGPSGAFSIDGINGQPNRDGKFLIIVNKTGQNMTFNHESGSEPTAANRVYTMTGAARATTGDGAAMLIYSGAASRWLLISIEQ